MQTKIMDAMMHAMMYNLQQKFLNAKEKNIYNNMMHERLMLTSHLH